MAGLIGAFAQGAAQPMSQMTNTAMEGAQRDQLLERETAIRKEMDARLAEQKLEAGDTEYNRQLGLIGAQSAARVAEKDPLDKQIKLQQLKNEQEKGNKPVYPKIVKLKDDYDKEYLIDQNTGAIGRPVSATEGLPAKSHWFSPDEPAVPGTKAGIVWTASDGQELPGGLASLYSQIKKPDATKTTQGEDTVRYDAQGRAWVKGSDGKPILQSEAGKVTEPAAPTPAQGLIDKQVVKPTHESYADGVKRMANEVAQRESRNKAKDDAAAKTDKAKYDAETKALENKLAMWQKNNPNPAKGQNAYNQIEALKYTLSKR